MFLLAFTSADIIFHNILELHSTLTDEKIFVTKYLFVRSNRHKLELSFVK